MLSRVLGLKLCRFALEASRARVRLGLRLMRPRRLRVGSRICLELRNALVLERSRFPLAGALFSRPGGFGLVSIVHT